MGFVDVWERMQAAHNLLGGTLFAAVNEIFMLPDGERCGYGPWGILDSWRRPKPDYWHVKMGYAPARVTADRWTPPPSGEPLRIPVENRHDFTNLSELRILWHNGDTQGLATADVPPRSAGVDTINDAEVLREGNDLELTFTSPQGFEVARYRLSAATPETAEMPESSPTLTDLPAPRLTVTPDIFAVEGTGFDLAIGRDSGLIRHVHVGGRPC